MQHSLPRPDEGTMQIQIAASSATRPLISEGERPADTKAKRFCDRSCAARFNNKGIRRHGAPSGPCQKCGDTIQYKKRSSGFTKRKFCEICLQEVKCRGVAHIDKKTKGEACLNSSHRVYAYNKIRARARRLLKETGRVRCEAPGCGYEKHTEACHRKGITEFPDDALVSKINDPTNLLALCPTHHWEFDHGLLEM